MATFLGAINFVSKFNANQMEQENGTKVITFGYH